MREENKEKIKKNKKEEIDQDFAEVEGDKRVIVFAVIALIIIISTVIVLVVGCQGKEEVIDKNNNKDKTVLPSDSEDNDEVNIEVKSQEEVVPEKIVQSPKKTVVTKVQKKNDESPKQEIKEEPKINTFEIKFYYNNASDLYSVNVNENDSIPEYVPEGQNNCRYYKNDIYTLEYDMLEKVTSNIVIYIKCDAARYGIIYDHTSNNPITYSTDDGEILLTEPTEETNDIFDGWYLDPLFTEKIESLNEDIISHVNSDNEINIYAKYIESYIVNYYNGEDKLESSKVSSESTSKFIIKDGSELGDEDNIFLGWSKEKDSNEINYSSNEEIDLNESMNLYAVFGFALLIYTENGENVKKVGISSEEVSSYGEATATDSELGVPIYYVPVEEDDEVVSEPEETPKTDENKGEDENIPEEDMPLVTSSIPFPDNKQSEVKTELLVPSEIVNSNSNQTETENVIGYQ